MRVKSSRRRFLSSLGAVRAAASVPALAQSGTSHSTAQPIAYPTTKYPKPPFREQNQPWPGLASKMDPKPDHGESSYKGSGRLTGRKALITGGDSGMGRAT